MRIKISGRSNDKFWMEKFGLKSNAKKEVWIDKGIAFEDVKVGSLILFKKFWGIGRTIHFVTANHAQRWGVLHTRGASNKKRDRSVFESQFVGVARYYEGGTVGDVITYFFPSG